jgi:hypothetical protein
VVVDVVLVVADNLDELRRNVVVTARGRTLTYLERRLVQ